jgi:hypothetical protein
MLACLHALCAAAAAASASAAAASTAASSAPQPPLQLPLGRFASRASGFGLDGAALDRNLDTSAYVPAQLRPALRALDAAAAATANAKHPPSSSPSSPTASAAAEPTAHLAHALLSFNAAWVAYMDAFMVWKQGDGMRVAQVSLMCFLDLYDCNK